MPTYLHKWSELWRLHSVKALALSIVTDVLSGLMFVWQPEALWALPWWFAGRATLGVVTIYLRNIKQ